MMKKLRFLISGSVTFGVLFSLVGFGVASAATFNQNNIIDDIVFDNTNTMTAAQIDAFLNTFPSSCISTNNGFSAIDPTGYNPIQGFLYGGFVSAGQVIYDATQAYGLNPQVILATLQKEQSLVDGSAGCSTLRYTGAAGYGCPDGGTSYSYSGINLYAINGTPVTSVNGTCVNTSFKSGFTQQIIRATWVLKFAEQRSEGNVGWAVIKGAWDNSDDPISNYSGYMTQGTWATGPSSGSAYYDGYATIDLTAVHMDNGPTAALYRYTPHFHGNQLFFSIFNSWFGSTYGSLVSAQGGGVYKIENVNGTLTKRVFPDGITFLSYGYRWSDITLWSSSQLDQTPNGAVVPYNAHFRDGKYVMVSDGVYLVENGIKRAVPDGITLLSYSYKWSDVVTISALEMSKLTDGAVVPYYAHFRNGKLVTVPSGGVYLVENGKKRPFPDGATFLSYGYTWSNVVAISAAELSYIPDGADMPYNVHFRDGKYVKSPDSDGVYLIENGYKRPVPDGITLLSYSYSWSNVVTISALEMSKLTDGAVVPYYAHFRNGKLVTVPSGGVYLVENGKKRPFPDGATFLSYGYTWSNVVAISAAELSYIPDGADMPIKA